MNILEFGNLLFSRSINHPRKYKYVVKHLIDISKEHFIYVYLTSF